MKEHICKCHIWFDVTICKYFNISICSHVHESIVPVSEREFSVEMLLGFHFSDRPAAAVFNFDLEEGILSSDTKSLCLQLGRIMEIKSI